MLDLDSKKIIFKVFDRKNSGEKRPHTCSTCAIYKREIAKGNREAFEFYKLHIMEVAKRNDGVTFILYGKTKKGVLTSSVTSRNVKL
jgi:hypothetical protein